MNPCVQVDVLRNIYTYIHAYIYSLCVCPHCQAQQHICVGVTSLRPGRSVTKPMNCRHHLQQQKHGIAHIFTDIKIEGLQVDVDALSTPLFVRRLKGPTHSGHLWE